MLNKSKQLACYLAVGTLFGYATVNISEAKDTSFTPQNVNEKLDTGYVQGIENFAVILDASGSMTENYNGQQKLALEKEIASRMNQTIPDLKLTAASWTFGDISSQPTEKTTSIYGPTQYTKSGLDGALQNVTRAGGTSPLELAINATTGDLQSSEGKTAVIIMSDGANMGKSPLAAVEKMKASFGDRLCIHTVAIGDNAKGKALLGQIAQASGCGIAVNADNITSSQDMAGFVETVFLAKAPASAKAPEAPKVVETVPVAVMVVDSDGDGVADDKDQCPGTPRGVRANALGCWALDMVHFDFDKANIKPEYVPLLQEAMQVLKDNPSMQVEIQGYTDSIGTPQYNQLLSQKRAKAIQDYLVENGIPQEQLSAKGYGQYNPIAGNESAAGRAQNRRSQFTTTN
jgi:OOP family OmpA-OmpF porin